MAWELFHNPPTSLKSLVRVISADMVAPSNQLDVRFAPNRYRDIATRRTVERCQKQTSGVMGPASVRNSIQALCQGILETCTEVYTLSGHP